MEPNGSRRPSTVLMATLFAAVCVLPIGLRLAHPSLFSDDVTRIGQMWATPSLGSLLFIPFNEHMAPLFQAVSWTTWKAAGHRLANAPMAFTVAAFVPHVLSLVWLGVLVRRETRSTATALAASAAMALSGTISETFLWYSASSFSWAMLGTIAAVDCAGRAATVAGPRRIGWLIASACACLLAPSGSAIGLLATPAAMARLLATPGLTWRARLSCLVPSIGTALYLAICSAFRYREVVADSLGRNIDLRAALRNIACAPADVLLPGFFGRASWESILPDRLAMAISVGAGVAVLLWSMRDVEHRGLILIGLGLIVGGYGLVFGARSFPGSPVVLHIQRYQLFPQLGLVLLMSVAARRWLSKFDGSSRSSVRAGVGVAMALLCLQIGPIRDHARYFRWPEQARTLAAIEHLDRVCRREGITRDQALAALDPVRKRWFNHDFNALMLLPPGVTTSGRVSVDARGVLLGALDPSERGALCGGMDVSRQLSPAPSSDPAVVGRLIQAVGFDREGSSDRWFASGWGAFLEYDLSPGPADDAARVRLLALPVGGPVELWWSEGAGGWSESRSIRWWPSPSPSPETTDWAMPLDRLPHWDKAKVRRVRIVPRRTGALAAGTPRLLR